MKANLIQIGLCLLSILSCVACHAVISAVYFVGACVIWALEDKR